MNPNDCSRRTFLGMAALTASAIAGCAAVEPPAQSRSHEVTTVESSEIDEDRFADLYDAASDAVVELRVQIPDDPFEDGGGSGFFVDDDVIVTNAHVVRDSDMAEIRFGDDTWGDGTVIGVDPHSDLAVIETDVGNAGSSVLGLADDIPPIGTEVMAIGSPFGFSASATTGIVSGVDRSLPAPTGFSIPAAIQTDAAINPGNSGGPLMNLAGAVVGVVFAGAGENVGFAIATPLMERVLPVLIAGDEYEHAYMGVELTDVSPRIAEANDVPEAAGVYIHDVVENGPADGVLQGSTDEQMVDGEQVPVGGDVIVGIDETEIPHLDAFSTYLALETAPGDLISIDRYHEGSLDSVDLELESRPDQVSMP